MSLSVRKAVDADCYSVCNLLKSSTLNSNWIKPKIRKRMFEHPWGAEV